MGRKTSKRTHMDGFLLEEPLEVCVAHSRTPRKFAGYFQSAAVLCQRTLVVPAAGSFEEEGPG